MNHTYTSYSTTSRPEIILPAKASEDILTFNILVTASNGDTRPYTINFDNPQKNIAWSGTASLIETAPLGTTIVFDHVEVEYAGGATSSANMAGSNNWSVTLDENYTPTAFVAVMLKTVSPEEPVTIRQSFTPQGGQSNITLSVNLAETARMIYNATDFSAIQNYPTENWYLANDIALPDSTSGWLGPAGYSGKFNGNGRRVTNMVLSRTNSDTGLFSTLAGGAVVENFTLEVRTGDTNGLLLTGVVRFGGIVGGITDQTLLITLKGITVRGDLIYRPNPNASYAWQYVGGLLGEVNVGNILIENCLSEINIIADYGELNHSDDQPRICVGGLVGKILYSDAIIKNSYATGSLSASSK
jgi:hypothetical protein